MIALVRAAKFTERRIAAWITVLTTTSVVAIRTTSANTASTGFAGNAASSAVERVIAQIDTAIPAQCPSRWASLLTDAMNAARSALAHIAAGAAIRRVRRGVNAFSTTAMLGRIAA